MTLRPPLAAELFRLTRTRSTWILLLIPTLVAVMRICGARLVEVLARARQAAMDGAVPLEEMESGFGPLADGLRTGAIVLTLIALVAGALQIVKERESGALGLSFLGRPRGAVVFGKAVGLCVFVLAGLVLLAVGSIVTAELLHGLTAIVDEGFEMASAAELWTETVRGLSATIPALFASALFGLAISSMTSTQGAAVACTLVPFVIFDLLKGLLEHFSDMVFVTYAPFLGSSSPLSHLTDIARALSDAEWMDGELMRATTVPALWGIGLLLVAVLVTGRRSA